MARKPAVIDVEQNYVTVCIGTLYYTGGPDPPQDKALLMGQLLAYCKLEGLCGSDAVLCQVTLITKFSVVEYRTSESEDAKVYRSGVKNGERQVLS